MQLRCECSYWVFLPLSVLGAAPAQGIQPTQPADVLGKESCHTKFEDNFYLFL